MQFEQWHDFFVLIGTAAATLMGLTFVAVSLAPDLVGDRTTTAVRAFTTPIVAFFATILMVSVVLIVPGMTPTTAGGFLAACGAIGFIYILSAGVHRQWREAQLGFDDWIWYLGLPLVGYGALFACAVWIFRAVLWGPYVGAAALLLLLIIGIRNAWDVVLALAQHHKTP